MANNIYIGNRYVPIFADPVEWDSLRSYDALMIVTYLGTSYTSKKPVPVGIPLSNKEYWVVTGNYNAQVAQLSDDVDGLTTSVNNLSSSVAQISSDISDINGDISDINGDISDINNDITTSNSEITKLKNSDNLTNRVFAFIGDSFNDPAHAWCFTESLATRLDATIYNYSHDGSGFTRGNPAFLGELQTALTEHGSTLTDIIIYGGNNDYDASVATLTTAAETFFEYYKENVSSNVKLHVFMTNKPNGSIKKNYDIYNTVIKAATNKGVQAKFYDGVNALQICNFGYNAVNDGHPSANFANNILAPYMAKCIDGGSNDFALAISANVNSNINVTAGSADIVADSNSIGVNGFTINYTGNQVVGALDVCTYTVPVHQPSDNSEYAIHGFATDGTNYRIAELNLRNDTVGIRIFNADVFAPNSPIIISAMFVKVK